MGSTSVSEDINLRALALWAPHTYMNARSRVGPHPEFFNDTQQKYSRDMYLIDVPSFGLCSASAART